MRIMRRVAALLSFVALCATGCASGAARDGQTSGTLITRDELARRPGEPLARVLERYVPGVIVTRTSDGSFALRLRGTGSIAGRDGFPLYVLDGSPIAVGPEGEVPTVNTFDIESVRVLKGTEAGAYGINGLNGVIIITMRKR